ncbi:MAG: hypothetical protein ACLPN6_25410 [Streptosporangiaceae bacterium]|jgi:hypothetical protein
MRLTRTRAFLTAGLVAVAGTAAGTVLAAGPASAGPAAASSGQVVLVNPCSFRGQVRPAAYDIGCMPSSELVGGLTWTSWRSVAFGSGRLEVNNCTPSSKCGPSKYTKYPILVVLWRAAAWPKHPGQEYFSRMTWIFTGKRPAHTPVTLTITLPYKPLT